MSTLSLSQTKNEIFYHGKDPPDIQGEFVQFRFLNKEIFKKEFIDRCMRLSSRMYEYNINDSNSKTQKRLKKFIQEEYAKNRSLKGYVHNASKYIRSTRERRHKWYADNKYKEIKGYQYYTIEFNFSNGLYEMTSDVLLFIQILEYEHTTSTYWVFYPDNVDIEIIMDE